MNDDDIKSSELIKDSSKNIDNDDLCVYNVNSEAHNTCEEKVSHNEEEEIMKNASETFNHLHKNNTCDKKLITLIIYLIKQ